MKIKRKKGFFSISAVSKMFSIHQQTIRLYEKEGLLSPKRSAGNTRLFSEEDIDRLEEIIYLTHQLRINLAGVEMILKLKKQISKMQKDMNMLFEKTQYELTKQGDQSKELVHSSMKDLLKIHNENKKPEETASTTPTQNNFRAIDEVDIDDTEWEIDYEEG
jgi:MerR family transcriptional regulator/heat shock protein HspR